MTAGKAKAFKAVHAEMLVRTLYEAHGKALLAFAERLTGDRLIAEQVTQETLVRAWRENGLMAGQGLPPRGLLFTVTRNVVAERRQAEVMSPLASIVHEGPAAC
ncbi:sigma factor [Streptomyces sp. NPDC007851]|uniref:sigma factor n=1 Tax=Streptomyces sp. NPDC007851 TaxID=3155008 RepID=UPI003405F3D0